MSLSPREADDSAKVEETDARIEMIVDLNRRIVMLDELMMAARAKRCCMQQSKFLPVVPQPA